MNFLHRLEPRFSPRRESYACLNDREHRNYGSAIKTGDILEIKLNQVEHTLEFLKNGVSQGIAHKNLPVQRYKLAVSFCNWAVTGTSKVTGNIITNYSQKLYQTRNFYDFI